MYSWNQERATDEVIIRPKPGVGVTIRSAVESYLDFLGFRSLDPDKISIDERSSKRHNYHKRTVHAWKVNLVNLTYELSIDNGSLPSAWPSQLRDFMEKHKASLTGRRFGI
jgi:hypothetical protein